MAKRNPTLENMEIVSNFWHNKRVLITGHTGFKGSWLLLMLLEKGAKICGFSLSNTEEQILFENINPKIEGTFDHNIGDILDIQALKSTVETFKPEIVFHLAAQPLVRKSYLEPINTWKTNVIGTINLLESLKDIRNKCVVVVVTTDKVYENNERNYSFKEEDRLGGFDPYSASKAACELAISSWRSSFCGNNLNQTSNLSVASARAGNVIGGGDWSLDRIIPDTIRGLNHNKTVIIRNPLSKRPWQHVLDPLNGYLMLAEKLYLFENCPREAYNFGPQKSSNKTVKELVTEIFKYWPGKYELSESKNSFHESKLLSLSIEKVQKIINWNPVWDFYKSIYMTINWYKEVNEGTDPYLKCLENIKDFQNDSNTFLGDLDA